MKALILVGGYGTRLRPLTLSRPKPLVEFCNEPIIFHQLTALIDAGVDTIVFAVSYMSDTLEESVNEFAREKNITVIFSKENEPLGTGGPIALARPYLDGDEPFFVMNSDIITVFPFKEMLDFHKLKNAEATIAVTKVDEPSKYGVIVFDENKLISRFVEKPSVFISSYINAGLYVLNCSVLDRIKLEPTSIEKEVFPFIAHDKLLYAYELSEFWMDIGQPHDYLIGQKLYIDYLVRTSSNSPINKLHPIYNRSIIHDTAKIGQNCHIVDSVIGEHVTIGDGVCVKSSVILPSTTIDSYSFIDDSIIGWNCIIGKWARIQSGSIVGEDVTIKDELVVSSSQILPHKTIVKTIRSEIIM